MSKLDALRNKAVRHLIDRPTLPFRRSSGAKFLKIGDNSGVPGIGFRGNFDMSGFDLLEQLVTHPYFLDALEEAGQMVEEEAQRWVPKPPTPAGQDYQRTGNLSNSIIVRWGVINDYMAVIEVGVPFENADYAIHVEYGTSSMSAQPFMRPAIDNTKGRIAATLAEELRFICARELPKA